ncbi:NAD-dependent epimerase/dehydratase family protein [Deinococcus sp. Leaf326]|uniref:NAD-dependent epimerase/dehydratase family protein n=1 Tax=Deinococcus sp. Leaf326 TaxID=1736338 RepID=UPI0006F9DF64|nr:NAD-dependent epimerase/dehydratase family protein [Deinococcus sp. Leaf326]KQR33053.1 NAD-dependent epimerase [Deinococcus sp. Leaf326]
MDILILGGTRFVGRHIVEAFVAAGHRVTVLTRGQTAADLPAGVKHLTGDRDAPGGGLEALAGRRWDACVDVSGYQPRQVRASTAALRARVDHYVFISTVSVYAEQDREVVRESDPLLPACSDEAAAVTSETYGPLKVACEALVQAAFPDASTILRPQIVAGPDDYTRRYPYWPDRAARAGEGEGPVLVPGDGQDFLQVIDARDLARLTVWLTEARRPGVFNVSGPRLTWAEFLRLLGVREVRWASLSELQAVGAAPHEFPVFLPRGSAQSGLMNVDHTAALAAGLTLTDPAVTAEDTRAWSRTAGLAPLLPAARESELLAYLDAAADEHQGFGLP